jgi:hypothetical protein
MHEDFQIPQCYHVNAPSMSTKIKSFPDKTLFYVFYNFPQDTVQLEAAEEL